MTSTQTLPEIQKAVRWYPPSYDIRVKDVPVPRIQHPDDAIVKVKLAGLCGSDLHAYRGHEDVSKVHTCGHEIIGEVVALGENFKSDAHNRPSLYSSLKIGDKVVSPFTATCGECHFCRLGYTGSCPEGYPFGSPILDGGQAQFVRVPRAGGTLLSLSEPSTWSSALPLDVKQKALSSISDSSLLLLADILPTGLFAATQLINHPKVAPVITGKPWPLCFSDDIVPGNQTNYTDTDRILTIAIIGLGPVGVCATVSTVDILATRKIPFRIVAIDPIQSRREKMQTIYNTINKPGKGGTGEFTVLPIEEAKVKVDEWSGGIGATAVLEVVGNTSALNLGYELVRAFGVIVSVGYHGELLLPFTGRQLYNKNVSLDFGRCPARAMFPPAFDLLVRRQDVFGKVGEPASLIDRIVDFDQATEIYRVFDKGEVGKVIFDPWK